MTDDLPRRRGWRLKRPREHVALGIALCALTGGTLWTIYDDTHQVKIASVATVVVVLSSLVLRRRSMAVMAVAVVAAVLAVLVAHGFSTEQVSASGVVLMTVALAVGYLQARRRDRLGLRQISAEQVLTQIRDRLAVQSKVPDLPSEWQVQVEQRPADGAAICGDFVASRLVAADGRSMLHLAVLDVSGSGISAGPRSLLLAGAVGGLLGTVDPDRFLSAANEYLMRQEWPLGFASAIYVVIDLDSGDYCLRVAGHPPALAFRPGSEPTWVASSALGTVLGVMPALAGVSDHGTLGAGESLYLFTDGVIDDRNHDLDAGTERLQAIVESVATRDEWGDLATRLIEQVPAALADDRTLVVIRRTGVPGLAEAVRPESTRSETSESVVAPVTC
jgi:serine phosphatase RsbU (regulator of sigma subunit)